MADATYIEPITPEIVAKIIEKSALTLYCRQYGQTGLNTALSLEEMGVLDKFGVEMIGANATRLKWLKIARCSVTMDRIGLENPKATIVTAFVKKMEQPTE